MADTDENRIDAGRRMVKVSMDRGWTAELADSLVEAYLSIPGRGDPLDARSNAVDIMTDLGHFLVSEGFSFEDASRSAEGQTSRVADGDSPLVKAAADAIRSLKGYLEARGESHEEALSQAEAHLKSELASRPGP